MGFTCWKNDQDPVLYKKMEAIIAPFIASISLFIHATK
jgi:hypothetical protein